LNNIFPILKIKDSHFHKLIFAIHLSSILLPQAFDLYFILSAKSFQNKIHKKEKSLTPRILLIRLQSKFQTKFATCKTKMILSMIVQ